MEATIVDLRYRMNDIIKALDRNEDVTILYRGKPRGVIKPKLDTKCKKVKDHPFFNMRSSTKSVEAEMDDLRGGRYRAL